MNQEGAKTNEVWIGAQLRWPGAALCLCGGAALVWGPFFLGLFLLAAGLVLLTQARRRGASNGFKEALRYPLLSVLVICLILWLLSALVEEAGAVPDFAALYVGGKLVREEPSLLYSVDGQVKGQREVTGLPLDRANFIIFPYPPFVAGFFSLFSALPYEVAFNVWLLVNMAILVATLSLLIWFFQLNPRNAKTLAFGATIWFPVYQTLVQGQTSLCLLLLLTLFIVELWKDREVGTGTATGLLAFKPQFLLIPVFVLIGRRWWNGLGIVAGFLGGLAFLSVLLVGWNGIKDYRAILQWMASGEHPSATMDRMVSLRAFSHYLGTGDAGWILTSLGVLLLFTILVRRPHVSAALKAVCAVIGMLLISPHLHMHDLVLGLLALALYLFERSEPLDLRHRITLYFLCLTPIFNLILWGYLSRPFPLVPITLLLLFLVLVFKPGKTGSLLT
jgi:hypothetical protein